ncbi:MAG: LamG-like jellyroll fold domain-containing protein [Kiritimatiellia bacterium]
MRGLILSALAAGVCALSSAAQETPPLFRLPLEFPAAGRDRIAFQAAGPDTNWSPVGLVAELPASFLGPAGTRWVSVGVEQGSLLLTTCTARVTAALRPVPDSSGTNARPFTVSAWVYMKDATWFTMADKGNEWLFAFDRQDRLGFTLGAGNGKAKWSVFSRPLGADEEAWHHYAAVVANAGPAPRVILYRDGEVLPATVEASSNAFPGLQNGNAALGIGSGSGMRLRSRGALGGVEVAVGAPDDAAMKALYEKGAAALAWRRASSVELNAVFPGEKEVELWNPEPWYRADALRFTVTLPVGAPTNCETLVYVKDWDWLWYQHLAPGCLVPGASNSVVVALNPESEAWTPVGHDWRWNFRTLAEPRKIGIRIFCKNSAWTGTVSVIAPEVRIRPPVNTPPAIRDVRPAAVAVARDGKFEVSFRITDRHLDPFDTNVVRVAGLFTAPDGQAVEVEGFYTSDFYRDVTPAGERITPQGGPLWRVRYAPRQEGVYAYTLKVRDEGGETAWGPGTFTALPTGTGGFIRVSEKDPRFFEFTDGRPYFPIGHNIRSPFDTRHDTAFPWEQRFETGSAKYADYFQAMAANGEQWAEVWFASWSLGLEWNERWQGYHGVGRYNMRHAWELDRVVDEAARHDIHLNLVINNHGKFSLFSDAEFQDNPYNADNGGYLLSPDDFFTDPRAMEDYRKLMRYVVARWGYSRQVFAWELFSELDLVGAVKGFYHKSASREWHRTMGAYIKSIDPNRHLVGTHVSGDYSRQDAGIIALPELDHCPVDAYHGNSDPVAIVELMKATARHNNPLNKPVLITEFGGSSSAASLPHLRATLHAGLWGSTGVPLGGTPMLWWWMAIDEQNWYPVFGAVSRFMKDVDRRDPELLSIDPAFSGTTPAGELAWACMRSPRQAIGWVCRSRGFEQADLSAPPGVTNLTAVLTGLTNGAFTVEYWDTLKGEPAARAAVAVSNGVLTLAFPPFVRDMAFKARLAE